MEAVSVSKQYLMCVTRAIFLSVVCSSSDHLGSVLDELVHPLLVFGGPEVRDEVEFVSKHSFNQGSKYQTSTSPYPSSFRVSDVGRYVITLEGEVSALF